MGSHQLASLIKMANQIADNNAHVGSDSEVAEIITDHIRKFWSRAMKEQIITYNQNSEENQLNSVAQNAVTLL